MFFSSLFFKPLDYELLDRDKIKFHPTKFKHSNKLKLTFNLFNQSIVLDLELNDQLISSNFTVLKRSTKLSTKHLEFNSLNCFYHGSFRVAADRKESNANLDNIVSLSVCDDLKGFIQTANYLFLINPLTKQLIKRLNLFNKIRLNKDLILIRRTKNSELIKNLMKQVIANKVTRELNENSQQSNDSHRVNGIYQKKLKRSKRYARSDYHNPTIELAVFADEALYNYLKNVYFIVSKPKFIKIIY